MKERWDKLLSRQFDRKRVRLYLMLSVFINTDRNKRGQTCYIVFRAQIQTCCFFEWKYKYASFRTGERERKLIDISSLFNIYTGSPSSKYEHQRASALLRRETIGFFSHTNPYILNVT